MIRLTILALLTMVGSTLANEYDVGAAHVREGGLVNREEFGTLLNLLNLKCGVEVGTQMGEYSQNLLTKWTKCERFHVVDVWDQLENYIDPANVPRAEQDKRYELAMSRLKPWKDRNILKVHRMFSSQAAQEISSLDFVYLDARHDYKGVMEDLQNYWPLVRRGGIMAGHDFLDCDPGGCGNPSNKWQVQFDGSYRYDNKAVKGAVLDFFRDMAVTIHVTQESHPYKSWYVFKQ